jgi:membrane protease YdiL (CAAX protease family)
MQLSDIFINSAGRLRSGWRLAIFVFVFFLLSQLGDVFLYVAYRFVGASPGGLVAGLLEVVFRVLLFLTAAVAGWGCGRLLEDLPWRALGWSLHRGFLRDLLLGCLVGGLSLMLAAGIATAFGGLRFSFSPASALEAVAQTILISGLFFLIAAAAEEVLFRGYPLQTLTRAGLAWLGVFLTSVPFAAVHLSNPNMTNKGIIFTNTALAGVWLAVACLRTRSLWFPLGVHWAWNWTMAALLGIPVSGITEATPNPLLHSQDLGPAWLTGGAYGIEGGLVCTIALIVSTIFIWRAKFLSATEEMRELTSHEIPRRAKPLDVLDRQDQLPNSNQPPPPARSATADD